MWARAFCAGRMQAGVHSHPLMKEKGVKPEVGIGAVHFILDARFAAYAASAQGDEPALNVKPGDQPPV